MDVVIAVILLFILIILVAAYVILWWTQSVPFQKINEEFDDLVFKGEEPGLSEQDYEDLRNR